LPSADPDTEDTLDLKLPPGLLGFVATDEGGDGTEGCPPAPSDAAGPAASPRDDATGAVGSGLHALGAAPRIGALGGAAGRGAFGCPAELGALDDPCDLGTPGAGPEPAPAEDAPAPRTREEGLTPGTLAARLTPGTSEGGLGALSAAVAPGSLGGGPGPLAVAPGSLGGGPGPLGVAPGSLGGEPGPLGRAAQAAPLTPGDPLAGTPASNRDPGRLLDRVADWAATETPVGPFRLVPADPVRDLPLIAGWMNDPVVAEFWQLAGDPGVTETHLRAQTDGDGRSMPCLGVLDGVAMSYWEIYRADLDPLARHYPARPHDTGVHLLIGRDADRSRGLGTALLRAVADLVLEHRPACTRVVAEPDVRNARSVAAFRRAGFRQAAELPLPDKRAALMIRERTPRP
jgi:hypothetical protein